MTERYFLSYESSDAHLYTPDEMRSFHLVNEKHGTFTRNSTIVPAPGDLPALEKYCREVTRSEFEIWMERYMNVQVNIIPLYI